MKKERKELSPKSFELKLKNGKSNQFRSGFEMWKWAQYNKLWEFESHKSYTEWNAKRQERKRK